MRAGGGIKREGGRGRRKGGIGRREGEDMIGVLKGVTGGRNLRGAKNLANGYKIIKICKKNEKRNKKR